MWRIGGVNPVPVDARIISATNKNLAQMVSEGTFRPDLYYRLKVVEINVPPLRERREEIIPLANLFIDEVNCSYGLSIQISEDVLNRLQNDFLWPGNIRELKHCIQSLVAYCAEKQNINSKDLKMYEVRNISHKTAEAGAPPEEGNLVEKLELELVKKFLAKAEGNLTKAARMMGISRASLAYKIRKYGL
jgi:transcriptional regulator with PAS, ATPase and Fis domain